MRRVVCLVADGLGVGEAPDAKNYGDEGADTLRHIAESVREFSLPNLEKLGLGNLKGVKGVSEQLRPTGFVGKMREKSKGKDTTTGHWEMAGVITEAPFPVYLDGFPGNLIDAFVKNASLNGVLGNYASSGTEIIQKLGDEHLRTLKPIVYTSQDSVFQIAAHEGAFGLERLYQICEIARKLTLPYQIARVIARPFTGPAAPNFKRTENRRDFSLAPPKNLIDLLHGEEIPVFSVGKIEDIFNNRSITQSNHTGNNRDGLVATLRFLEATRGKNAFIFSNLVDFDMLYGHRRDPVGYAKALYEMDNFLPKLLNELKDDDFLFITSDHGCDPTFKGSDHTREYVPLIVYTPKQKVGRDLKVRDSFADISTTILEAFGIQNELKTGQSFLCHLEG